jgi:hypothetical protein
MQHVLHIDCPPELLLSLHMNAEEMADWTKAQAAIALYRDGRISSGMAANWLGLSRVEFLFRAMQAGARLLDDSNIDFRREAGFGGENHALD